MNVFRVFPSRLLTQLPLLQGKVASMSGADRESKSFGQVSSVSTGIQGLELLAKHKAERGDQDGAADDAAAWDVQESDSGAENSDEEGWIAVSSDDDQDIVISGDEESDSEDEDDDAEGSSNKKRKKKQRRTRKGKQAATEESDSDSDAPEDESEDEAIKFNLIDDDDDDDESGDEDDEDVADEVSRLQELATQQILTPADFAKINQLETAAAEEASKNGSSAARRRLAALNAAKNALPSSEFLTEGEILGARRKAKMDYAERMAHIQAGREGREKFGSSKGKKKNEKAHSTTNEEKKRTKNFLMSRNSKSVRTKKAASLKDNSKRYMSPVPSCSSQFSKLTTTTRTQIERTQGEAKEEDEVAWSDCCSLHLCTFPGVVTVMRDLGLVCNGEEWTGSGVSHSTQACERYMLQERCLTAPCLL